MEGKIKCLMEQYAKLQRLRDDLIKLKVEYRNAEERLQFHLQASNTEIAKLVSKKINILLKEISVIEKEIEHLKHTYCMC